MTADAKGMTADEIAMSKVRMFCLDMATKNNVFYNKDDNCAQNKSSITILDDAQKYFNFITGKEA